VTILKFCSFFRSDPTTRILPVAFYKESKYYLYDTGDVEGDLGAKLENTVACALLRDLHFIEDTTGSRVALHYLRDKEKHEVDFLPVIDNRPLCMIEVKASEEKFSPSLFLFRKKLEHLRAFQIVYGLKRKKSKDGVRMLSAHEFLRDFQLG
jgi:predicted AAA+ superfamily ATPase